VFKKKEFAASYSCETQLCPSAKARGALSSEMENCKSEGGVGREYV